MQRRKAPRAERLAGALALLAALTLAAPVGAQTITTNEPWSLDETHLLGRNPTWTGDTPAPPVPFSVDLPTYQTRRATCAGHANCEPQLIRKPIPFNSEYGWWCGGGRPVDGDIARTMGPLDPVDLCCKLHDKQVWSGPQQQCNPQLDAAELQVIDACGIYMCLSSRTPFDWSAFPPEVEEAREFWAQAALQLCMGGCARNVLSDQDCDGRADDVDTCPTVGSASGLDTDGDAIGNICDCDFDNDGSCGISDFNVFLPDFVAGTDGGSGTDMDADGGVGIADFNAFLPGFAAGEPGPGRADTCEALGCGNGICTPPTENCGQSLLGCAADCGLCPNGRFCLADADCQSGICNNLFQCVSCKSNGQVCLTDGVCCSGICNNAFQCASCRSNGQACLTNDVCCSGICNGLFQCASCRSFGQTCSSDGQCCSGNCNLAGLCGV